MRIYITGFMGSGKSYWGKKWAVENGLSFYDLDEIIEENEQLSIDLIFEKKGELYFRQKESALLRSTEDYENCIIACGGGTPCYDDNMGWMNAHGLTIWIEASPAQLFENMINETDKRPLLKNLDQAESINFIERKLKERNEFYKKAKVHLHFNELNPKSMENIIQIKK